MFDEARQEQSVGLPSSLQALTDPDDAARALALLAPGPGPVDVLALLQPRELSAEGAIDALAALEKQIAWLQAREQELLSVMNERAVAADVAATSAGRPTHDPAGTNFLREEVACALRLAPGTAQDRLDVAAALAGPLFDTAGLLRSGRISFIHARILAAAVRDLDARVTANVQQRVLARAPEQTPGEFRAAVRRAVARFDVRDEATRHEDAFAGRKVVACPVEDAMCDVWLHLAADGAASFLAAVNAIASTRSADDPRTLDQRRADAAVELALAALDDPTLPRAHGQRPSVQITVAATTLLGLDDQPAELESYGPVPASMAIRISEDPSGVWHRLITDHAGRLLDYETRSYQPPAALARHVISRDQRCVHPGCRRKAWNCEIDHRIPYPIGGTNAANLQPLCKRHHMMKHHAGWQLLREDDGSYEWIAPSRHRYRYRPPELPVPAEPSQPRAAAAAADDDPAPPF